MRYHNVTSGKFICRRNRFVATVEIDGKMETVHVKNTGRCKELLLPGVEVFLERSANPARKTAYDLIAVNKLRPGAPPLLINMDSQIPNAAIFEWLPASGLFPTGTLFKREVARGSSRFDIFADSGSRQTFIEVKGVTLENSGVAMFPDAPTARGVKHLRELVKCTSDGFGAMIIFVIQMQETECFTPHDAMHREFGAALRQAAAAGVKLLALSCRVTPDSITIDRPIKIQL